MAIFVYNGISLNIDRNDLEVTIGDDGKVYINQSSFWPEPLVIPPNKTKKSSSKKKVYEGGNMRTLVKENFSKKNAGPKLVRSASHKTIRSAFASNGWKSKVLSTDKSDVFEVTRVA